MKKIINYGIICFLVIILQFIWLQSMTDVLLIITSVLSEVSYCIFTFKKFEAKCIYKIFVYAIIFTIFLKYINVYAVMIIFPIIILVNKILDYYKKIESNKQFLIWNLILLSISFIASLLMKEVYISVENNAILSMIFVGIAILSCIYEANKIIEYNRFDVMDLIAIILSTAFMLCFSIYNINGFNEVIFDNNKLINIIQNKTIMNEKDLNDLAEDVINTVGITKIQEFELNEVKQELIIFKGLKNETLQTACIIKSLKYQNDISFKEKQEKINNGSIINILRTINNNMCKPEIKAIIISDFIYLLSIVTLFHIRKDD